MGRSLVVNVPSAVENNTGDKASLAEGQAVLSNERGSSLRKAFPLSENAALRKIFWKICCDGKLNQSQVVICYIKVRSLRSL